MMTAQAVLKRVQDGGMRGPGFDELREEWRAGAQVEEIGQGRMTTQDVRNTFAIRQRTAAKAGVRVEGLAELLSIISAMKSDDEVVLFHFGTRQHVFTVVIHEPGSGVVGCISVQRRDFPGLES